MVLSRLARYRKHAKTLLKWAQASLLDLHEVVDEAMAEELYFLVRSKMSRILSLVSALEEASEHIEQSLSNHFRRGGVPGSLSERGTSSTTKRSSASSPQHTAQPPAQDKSCSRNAMFSSVPWVNHMSSAICSPVPNAVCSPVPSFNHMSSAVCSAVPSHDAVSSSRLVPSDGASNPSQSGYFDDLRDVDLRIEIPAARDSPTGSEGNELEDLLLAWSLNSGSSSGGGGRPAPAADRSDMSTPRSASTPEPPLSPRPRALTKHPKIMKDKLHSMALPSKFPGVLAKRFSSSW